MLVLHLPFAMNYFDYFIRMESSLICQAFFAHLDLKAFTSCHKTHNIHVIYKKIKKKIRKEKERKCKIINLK